MTRSRFPALRIATILRLAVGLALVAMLLASAVPGEAEFNLLTKVSPGDRGNPSDGASFVGASQDGSRIFFSTGENVAGDVDDDAIDIYERSGATVTLVTPSLAGATPEDMSGRNVIGLGVSEDGNRLLYRVTEAHVPGETDGEYDIYMRANGVTTTLTSPA